MVEVEAVSVVEVEVEGRVEASKRVKRLPLLMAIKILNPRRWRWELFPSSISNPIE